MPIPTALKVLSPITGIISGFSGDGRRRRAGAPTRELSGRTGSLPSFKKGGRMKKKGVAKLHEGERIEGKKRRGRGRSR
jgi:hypothetical protein